MVIGVSTTLMVKKKRKVNIKKAYILENGLIGIKMEKNAERVNMYKVLNREWISWSTRQ